MNIIHGLAQLTTFVLYKVISTYDWIHASWNTHVQPVNKHFYKLHFIVNRQRYCILFRKKHTPNPISQAINKDGHDITDKVTAFLGPGHDFFQNYSVTPRAMDEKSVTIITIDGDTHTFNASDQFIL